MEANRILSQAAWLDARRALLVKEKAYLRAGDSLAEERRSLPWVKIEKNYTFDTTSGKKTLAELFGDRSQLIVHHFMFAPHWEAWAAQEEAMLAREHTPDRADIVLDSTTGRILRG